MPGIYRFSSDLLLKNIEAYVRCGGRGGIFFGVSRHKDNSGKYAYASNNPVVTAIKAVKKTFPGFFDRHGCLFMRLYEPRPLRYRGRPKNQ